MKAAKRREHYQNGGRLNSEEERMTDEKKGQSGLPPIANSNEVSKVEIKTEKKKKRRPRATKLLFSLLYTQYPLVKAVAK